MKKQNFLLGRGERLTADVEVRSGGAPKEAPYTFDEAKQRLLPMLRDSLSELEELPKEACPNDKAVVLLTLNPEYLAKSYFPNDLLRRTEMEVIGSRPKKIEPEKRSKNRPTSETITTELFARITRSSLHSWTHELPNWTEKQRGSEQIVCIEQISAPNPSKKVKGHLPSDGNFPIELVLHAAELETSILGDFRDFLEAYDLPTNFGRHFFAQGLCFLELEASAETAADIASFSAVRALRKMPELRFLRPSIRSSGIPTVKPDLPTEPPTSNQSRVAIFDGGVPTEHPITQWVTSYEFEGMKPATNELLEHGVGVSSAALFGHIEPKNSIPRPFSKIDHYRVLDDSPEQNLYELYEVLERIDSVLSSENYDFVNLSIGPCMPIEDDEIHAWTAVLDDRLAQSETLATIAVGNDGESDALSGLNRVQVPSDCVNALAIGACDSKEDGWQRASYSSVGPGRSPGLIKPDFVDFGGSVERPFIVLNSDTEPKLTATGGTSFAAPSVLRMASGIRAHFGPSLNHLAIRSLLIHTVEKADYPHEEIGWGRVAPELDDIVLCGDDTIRVVYQGEISPSKYIRAAVPMPSEKISGMVAIKATICYKSQIDPHHPSNYTRAGLELTFRPHDGKFTRSGQVHPDTKSFFGTSPTGATEDELRRDAWKWENCLHASKSMRGTSLQNPCFDIHYNSRLESRNFSPRHKLPYALVVTIQAKNATDLYDQVVRKYATQLEPMKPVLNIPIQT